MKPRVGQEFPRWSSNKFDHQTPLEVIIAKNWSLSVAELIELGLDKAADRYEEDLKNIGKTPMPSSKNQVDWWTPELDQLKAKSKQCYSNYVRYCKSDHVYDSDEAKQLNETWKQAKDALKKTVRQTRDQYRSQIIENIDLYNFMQPYRDAWEKLYIELTTLPESLDFEEAMQLELLPIEKFEPRKKAYNVSVDDTVSFVTDEEITVALKCLWDKTIHTPGKISGRTHAIILNHMREHLRSVFNECFLNRDFPKVWRDGRLHLLEKACRLQDSLSNIPLFLMYETGKVLERILVSRIEKYIKSATSEKPCNYTLKKTPEHSKSVLNSLKDDFENEVSLAVTLDITKALDTLPVIKVVEALHYHKVPSYLQLIIGNYLRDRYEIVDGTTKRRVKCGVPQGTELGHILWNNTVDYMLRKSLLPGMSVISCSDNTIATVTSKNYEDAERFATVGVSLLVERLNKHGINIGIHDKVDESLPGTSHQET